MSAKQWSHERQDPGDARDEFAWRAFCYLHGELTADEAEAFEENLATQQSAREALAQVVRVTQLVGNASPVGVRDTQPKAVAWWQRIVRARHVARAAVAACLALMVALGFSRFFRGPETPAAPAFDSQALAEAWLDVGADWSSQALPAAPGASEEDPAEIGGESHAAEDVLEDSRGLTVPSYYLAAVDPSFGRPSLDEEKPEIKQ
jgi:hypothetical protein